MTSPRMLLVLLLAATLVAGACHGRTQRPDTTAADRIEKAHEAEIATYPWPDYVTGEERAQIEDALHKIFEVWGREGREAEAWIVALDKDADAMAFRAVGRLVSEMKTVVDQYGVDNYEGKSRIMVLDRMLRRIDGVQERLFSEEYGLDIDDPPAKAMRIVRRWNWWYREGRFLHRYPPWDPREDMYDDPHEAD